MAPKNLRYTPSTFKYAVLLTAVYYFCFITDSISQCAVRLAGGVEDAEVEDADMESTESQARSSRWGLTRPLILRWLHSTRSDRRLEHLNLLKDPPPLDFDVRCRSLQQTDGVGSESRKGSHPPGKAHCVSIPRANSPTPAHQICAVLQLPARVPQT